jgi:hypothetical protein
MKKTQLYFLNAIFGFVLLLSFNTAKSQTAGTMTFTFTQTATVGTATKNVLAVWIEDVNGSFVKTRYKFVGGNTKDHLPTWAVKSGGTAANATSTACNSVDATTGATRTASTTPAAFGAQTVLWNGTNVSGAVVADGTYKVIVESSWCNPEPANNAHKFISTFTFTKGATASTVTPTDPNLTGITIKWTPTTASVDESIFTENDLVVFPNPSTGLVQLDFKKSIEVEKINITSITGELVYSEEQKQTISGIKTIDLSNFAEGVYMVEVVLPDGKSTKKTIVLKK